MKTNVKFLARDMAECAIFIVLMVVATYVQIPFALVPLTFQTVISVLAGLMLGAKKGVISMSVYCFMGLIGLPVFSSGGGLAYIFKVSFGYIIGFIFAALVSGLLTRKPNLPLWRYIVAALAGFLADYAIGTPYCMVVAYMQNIPNLTNVFIMYNLIYMPKDAALSVLAAVLAKSVLPIVRKRKAIQK